MIIHTPYALHEIGRRQNQEDSIFPDKGQANSNSPFFLVCDGMGGHENGEIASQTVCESFGNYLNNFPPDDFNEAAFEQALALSYDALDKKDKTPEHKSKMGTTLAFLHLNQKEAFMAHIGDSRIYHLRPANGSVGIVYKSEDHSLVNELHKAEVITAEEAENYPRKNVITRAMQPHLEKRCKADIHRTTDVRSGDYFFLCSDGVLESVHDGTLMEIISENTDVPTKMQAIYRRCLTQSNDNFSAYLISVNEGFSKDPHPIDTEDVQVEVVAESAVDDETEVTAPTVRIKEKAKKWRWWKA